MSISQEDSNSTASRKLAMESYVPDMQIRPDCSRENRRGNESHIASEETTGSSGDCVRSGGKRNAKVRQKSSRADGTRGRDSVLTNFERELVKYKLYVNSHYGKRKTTRISYLRWRIGVMLREMVRK